MKKVTRVFIGIILVFVLLASFLGSFFSSFLIFRQKETAFNEQYLAVYSEFEDTYYLQRADPQIEFYVDCQTRNYNSLFSLTDRNGETISVTAKRVNSRQFKILPPQGGYLPGQSYTLSLQDGAAFSGEELHFARSIVFCIEREAVEHYRFTDSVRELSNPVQVLSDTSIALPDSGYSVGDILFGQDENGEPVIYRIEDLTGGNTATVEIPALEEVYAELDVYGEYQWPVTDILTNPDLEIEIINNVKNSDFYSSLMVMAYASDKPKDGDLSVSITPDEKTNSLELAIKITLEPGENGLFGIGSLHNQKVKITLKTVIGLTTRCNIQGIIDWDLSASLTTGFAWQVDLEFSNRDIFKKDPSLEQLFAPGKFLEKLDYFNMANKITQSLNTLAADTTAGELKLFDWKLPIPAVPGLYFGAEVKLFAELNLAATLSVGQDNQTTYVVGVSFTKNKFNPYSNSYKRDGGVEIAFKGKASFQSGVKLVAKVCLINEKFAKITLEPQAGLYAEVFVTYPIHTAAEILGDIFRYSYFEPGVYFSADLDATLNLAVKKFTFTYELVEKKFAIEHFTYGNKKIALGVLSNLQTIRAVNNVFSAPEILFEYYNVKSGLVETESLQPSDVKYVTSDNTNLPVKNGKIELADTNVSGDLYVTASYLHTDGKSYSTTFRVIVSGSMLEGKVSAYGTTSAVEGATVQLFPQNSSTPITSQTTDEEGRFSFHVSQGEYQVVISASGYKTLSSTQVISADEIKYTEHILLIEDSQNQNGSAAGIITDAFNGRGLSGVTVTLRRDWNNRTGGYVDFQTTTDSSGKYTVSGIPAGYYTVEATLSNYVTGYANIIVLSDNPKNDNDFSITPILSDDEMRIILTWGEKPWDLDSHLIGRTPSDSPFNVYYHDKVYRYNSVEMANLDVDDITSYGPETITILQQVHGTYIYAIHDYTNRSSSGSEQLSYSDAMIRVYQGSNQIGEFHVPTGQIGTYWTVFEIDERGDIFPINTISNTKPSA